MNPGTVLIFFLCLFGQLHAGNFVRRVVVDASVFAVVESGSFQLKCTATHEDKRPQLMWYFFDGRIQRRNLTNFEDATSGTGNTATSTYRKKNVAMSDEGDYYCDAKVDNTYQRSNGVPIDVIQKGQEPRVEITKSYKYRKRVFTCRVVPNGKGDLTWWRGDDRVLSKENVRELVLESPSSGRYQCYGNLTVGGFKFFQSSAFVSGVVGWSQMTTQAIYLSTLLTCFFTFVL